MNTLTASKRKKGRPTAFTSATRRRLIRAIASGVPVCHACAACRVSLSGFHAYRASNPGFAAKIEQATGAAIEKHLRLIITAAETGDTASSRWFLERVHPSHFGRTKLELSGADGSPLAVGIGIYLPQKDSPETKTLPAFTTTKNEK
jgi:hypothetical protein